MKKFIATAVFPSVMCVSIALTYANNAFANLIQNGNFDTPDVTGSFVTFNNAPVGFGWTIVSDGTASASATTGFLGVDVINTLWVGTGGTANFDGIDQSLDIDRLSSISQSFATVVGQTYSIDFNYSHNPFASSASGRVSVDGATSLISVDLVHNTLNSASNMQWADFSNSIVADSTITTLKFKGALANDRFGFVVDDISVNAIPIPPAVWLFGSGLLGMIGIARRKKAA